MQYNPLHPLLKLILVFLLLRYIWRFTLLFDPSILLPLFLMAGLLYADHKRFEFTRLIFQGWVFLILLLMHGVKAGAKSLVIYGGNADELNMQGYYTDLFLFLLGSILGIRELFFLNQDEEST